MVPCHLPTYTASEVYRISSYAFPLVCQDPSLILACVGSNGLCELDKQAEKAHPSMSPVVAWGLDTKSPTVTTFIRPLTACRYSAGNVYQALRLKEDRVRALSPQQWPYNDRQVCSVRLVLAFLLASPLH